MAVHVQVQVVILPSEGVHDIVIHNVIVWLISALNIVTATAILPINDSLHVSEGVNQFHGTFLNRSAIYCKSLSITARCGQIIEYLTHSHLKLTFATFSFSVTLLSLLRVVLRFLCLILTRLLRQVL